MKVPLVDLPSHRGAARNVSALLEDGWADGLRRGAIAYDPADVETFIVPPFCFLLLPGRETRPRPLAHEVVGGLRRPHEACPFDEREFLDEREVIRAARSGRAYHVALNKYPVLPLHYLAIRPSDCPPETLPQRLRGETEIEDMILLAGVLGSPYRFFFNSNRGADGSTSGSSVNHWHFQIFPTDHGIILRPPRIETGAQDVEIGGIPDWPARHRLYRSRDTAALALAIGRDVASIDARDAAYNLEIAPGAGGLFTALLFPRAPVADQTVPGIGVISGDFGGFELSGNVVVPARKLFEWVRAHPTEAVRLVIARIRAGTSAPPPLDRLEA
jgi:hypothetical protein